jgi:hypothetical protein
LLLVFVKIGTELMVKDSILSFAQQQPYEFMPVSHLVGALVGLLSYVFATKYSRQKNTRSGRRNFRKVTSPGP